jgi:hypothetical protein
LIRSGKTAFFTRNRTQIGPIPTLASKINQHELAPVPVGLANASKADQRMHRVISNPHHFNPPWDLDWIDF